MLTIRITSFMVLWYANCDTPRIQRPRGADPSESIHVSDHTIISMSSIVIATMAFLHRAGIITSCSVLIGDTVKPLLENLSQ
jgi:hypothetical protein